MTVVDNRTEAVSALLSETEAAHGVFETTELNGVYDQDWPRWYATYAVEHGIGDLLGQLVTVDRLAQFLASTFDDFKAAEPNPTEPWVAWTARRITAEL
jgi:hypothetical protein